MIKPISIILATILLTGCGATLKDFQKMSPSEITAKTCSSNSMVASYRSKQRHYQSEINSLESLLMNGYKIVENCSTTTIDVTSIEYKNQEQKLKDPKTRVIKRCSEQSIPLTSYAIAKYEDRLSRSVSLLNEAIFNRQRTYQECKTRVGKMTPEDAYHEFKN